VCPLTPVDVPASLPSEFAIADNPFAPYIRSPAFIEIQDQADS
jgi:hypothetical protein